MHMRNFDLPGRSPVYTRNGMACTSHTQSTQVAVDVLQAGGNALDAAIAACAMQCVVEPQSTGIGGDCFALYAPEGRGVPVAYNGSGRAPAAASVEALHKLGVTELQRNSPHSVIVPGAVDAWIQLHEDHGCMPFAELLQPAIDTAREGYPLAPRVQLDIKSQVEYLRQFERASRLYLEKGDVPAVGSVRKLPELADSLAAIAMDGRDVFYRGHLAENMVRELADLGGLHTMEDFASARGEYVTPISTDFRGLTVYECPPNGQGMIALLLLNMMSAAGIDKNGPLTLERIHFEIEACRLAYRVRDQYLADPTQAQIPVKEILSKEFAAKLVASIDPSKTTVPPIDLEPSSHKDTVYISVVDKHRNVCSFINTVFWPFGSGITSSDGIVLTNRGMGFSMDPASPNCIAPGKRPLHTIIPGMASRDDKIELCFGVMGGEYQAMGQQQFLTRYLDYGCDIQEAMDLPRFMPDPFTGELEIESSIDAQVLEQLTARGHRLVPTADAKPVGGSQAIAIDWDNRVLVGGSDPRKDGCAGGY